MPSPRTKLVVLLALSVALPGMTQSALATTIGVVAPRSGPYALLGQQVFDGARAAAEANGDTLVEVDETCDEAGGKTAAQALVDGRAEIAIGFLCVETLTTAMPDLAAQAIPALSISVRSPILMEDALRNDWPFFRMAPAEAAEAEQVAAAIAARWKADPIALVDDGTIYGRELVNAVRQKLAPIGITPVFTDTLRPGQEQQIALVKRLQKAGATHVLIGADRNDVAVIMRDAAAEAIPLVALAGDVMRGPNRPVALRDGTLAVTLPTYQSLPEAAEASEALRQRGSEPEGNTLPAYAAAQIAHQAAAQAGSGRQIRDILLETHFQTVIGDIGFQSNHELADNPYRLLEWRGTDFTVPSAETE
ncbi:branched-chain amino acid transport system substrate-binding protein [Rhizobium sp. NFR07]|uniref:ABC transporter substrate-binding protein n=1 Tax=Rhizobium sp. NFR07 TaxID=1566262 RepID=UPI0008E56594|nr:ABC transporter substrate-binding protein [Rhizobium sp. NFR07]SFB38678.1 branched-chain amino acid transport system substrate-binding protein [Rhizobium sp. NFR07]